jgi:hypothetical protein
MGQLNDMKVKIDQVIVQKGLDAASIRGKIGMKAGVLLTLVNAGTPDDPAKVEKLKAAAQEVLGQAL